MVRRSLSFPELEIISGTRAAIGAGIGLLVANTMTDERRKRVGWSLLSVGLLSTIPIVIQLAMNGENRLLAAQDAHDEDTTHDEADLAWAGNPLHRNV